MAGENKELVIRISGEVKDFQAALELAKEETADLGETLNKIAKISAVAFAALTTEIFFSIRAYGEAEKASKTLTLALQNQGIYNEKLVDTYKSYADVVAKKTGIDDDNILQAQAVAQGYLGQTKITQELTNAIADLAETMNGDLSGAAEKIGRTIGTNTNAFARQGLEIDQTASVAERYTKVLEFVNTRAGGLAEKNNEGIGTLRGLKTAFGDVQEEIGKNFAPALVVAVKALKSFLDIIKNNPAISTFAASLIAGGAAVTGLGIVIPPLINALNVLRVALFAMGVELTAVRLAVIALGSAGAIGLLVTGVVLLGQYLLTTNKSLEDFKKNLPAAREEIIKLKKELAGLESPQNVAKGFDAFEETRKKQLRKRISDLEEATKEQEKIEKDSEDRKKSLGDKVEADKNVKRQREAAAYRAHGEVLKAEVEKQSADYIAAKSKEAELLDKIANAKTEQEAAQLQELYERQRQVTSEQNLIDLEKRAEFEAIRKETDDALNEQKLNDTRILNEKEIAEVQAQAEGKLEVSRNIAKQELLERQKAHNTFLLEEKKFGTAYATINQAMHSAIFQGTKSAFGELAALQQSSNNTLKSIGKVAAIANIVIRTAESAMNIYAGFSTIPIIGPALGVAGAAAAVAFGAEQVGKVQAAADGGLMLGGRAGVDSIPTLTMPGEIVAPTKNFEEVIGSVRAGREAQNFGGGSSETDTMMLNLLTSIDAKLSQPSQTNVFQGDVLADESYIDKMIGMISDRLEFGNAKIFGVNT